MIRIFTVFAAAVAALALVAAASSVEAKSRKPAQVQLEARTVRVDSGMCRYGVSITGTCAAPPTLCQQGLTANGTCTPQLACSQGRTADGQCVNPLLAAIMTQRVTVFTQPKFSRSGGSVVVLPGVDFTFDRPLDTIETQRTGEP